MKKVILILILIIFSCSAIGCMIRKELLKNTVEIIKDEEKLIEEDKEVENISNLNSKNNTKEEMNDNDEKDPKIIENYSKIVTETKENENTKVENNLHQNTEEKKTKNNNKDFFIKQEEINEQENKNGTNQEVTINKESTNTEEAKSEEVKSEETNTEEIKNDEIKNEISDYYQINEEMIKRIKSTIEENLTEDMKMYGYSIVIDSSIKEKTNQFTFTENRVKSAIVNKFGTIRIYAEDFYSDGQVIMTECYIF